MTELALKFVAKIVAGQSPESDAVSPLEAGLPFLQGNAEFGSTSPIARWETATAPKRAEPGDILVSVRAPVGAVNIADVKYGIGRGLCAVRPTIGHSRFFYWWLLSCSEHLNSVATGSTFTAISASDIGDLRISVVDSGEQRAIADFLDRETAEIDAFIADQEELIGLLTERRAATITHAVTKGLDPSAPMKDSGIEWLGEVPAHWSIGRVGFAYRLTLGKMVNAGSRIGEPRPYLRAGNIQETGIDIREVKTMPVTSAEATALQLLAGDVVVVEGGAGYGRSDVLSSNLEGWAFQNHVIRARAIGEQDSRFLDYTIKFLRARGHFEALGAYATIPNLSSEKLAAVEFPFLPLVEQSTIADYLDHETAELDAAIADAREAIALSKERRAALISAAVTGKIDVRNLA